MNETILMNLKSYITERQQQLLDRYECTHSDYSHGKLDGLDEISNYLDGELMYFSCENVDIYTVWLKL